MSMITPSSMWIYILVAVFLITFIFGFFSGRMYVKNIRNPVKEREKKEEEERKMEKELSDFYDNIYRSSKDLKPFLEILEMVIQDAINELPSKESELVCSTYNYYIRIFKEVSSGMKVSKSDLINFANIHSEYSKIVYLFQQRQEFSLSDLEKISLN